MVTGTVDVVVSDDALDEDDETFFLNLSNVTGANVTDAQGKATIVDDDPLPALAVGDATVTEGNSGSASTGLAITLTPVSGRQVTVDFTDVPGTATPGSDYLACSGTAVLAAGATTAPVSCQVLGDLNHEPDETFGVSLSNATNATVADGQGVVTIADDDPVADLLAGREVAHGFDAVYDLAAQPGPVSDQDWFRIGQAAYSSYEVTVESAGGDTSPLQLQRVGPDGVTVIEAAADTGPGEARSLRFENATGAVISDERIRVASGGCGTGCGADDIYRLRAYETTASIARFNNSSTQVTVLLIQNSGPEAVAGHVWFWRLDGKPGRQPAVLAGSAGAAGHGHVHVVAGRGGIHHGQP
jgi:hypothetical protein